MGATDSAATGGTDKTAQTRLSRWSRVALVIALLLGLGFAISTLVSSQAIVGSANKRSANSLAAVAAALETWPRTIAEVASVASRKNPSVKEAVVPHPQFGEYRIDYDACPTATGNRSQTAMPKQRFFPDGTRPGEGQQFSLSGPVDPAGTRCYFTRLPLDRVIDLEQTAPEFSNLLIVAPNETVLAQLGRTSLPLTKLPPLKPTSDFARDVSANLLGDKEQKPSDTVVRLVSEPGPVALEIGGIRYFGFVRPVRIQGASEPCPPPPVDPAASRPIGTPTPGSTQAAAPMAGQEVSGPLAGAGYDCGIYIVGLTRTDAVRRASLQPPPLVLTGFALASLIAIALLPALRFLLVGHTDSTSLFEVAAMVIGIYAATAIATLAALFAFEVAGERAAAQAEASRLAVHIAAETGTDIRRVLASLAKCRKQQDAGLLPRIYEAGPVDRKGEAWATASKPACARVALPGGTKVGGRPYFNKLEQGGGRRFGSYRYTIDQVRTQTDGLNKTAIAKMDPHAGYLIASTVLPSLVSPILPAPQRFMVVNGSDAALPVLFHEDPARAGVERFASEVKASGDVVDLLHRLDRPTDQKPATLSFMRRYDGHMSQFSAAKVPGTDWIVLVFHPLDEIDGIASYSAMRALGAWAGIAMIVLLAAAAFLLTGERWRPLWPFADADRLYLWAAPVILLVSLLAAAAALHFDGLVPLPIIVALCAAISLYLIVRRYPASQSPLRPATERRYKRLVLALLVCTAVVPVTVLWADARSLSVDRFQQNRLDLAATAIERRTAEIRVLKKALNPAKSERRRPAAKAAGASALPVFDPIDPWSRASVHGRLQQVTRTGLSAMLLKMQQGFLVGPAPACAFASADIGWLCWEIDQTKPVGKRLALAPRPPVWRIALLPALAIGALAALLAGLISGVVHKALGALTGFGIPLGAVDWPKLIVGDRARPTCTNGLRLPGKALLIAPQQAARDRVADSDRTISVNLADGQALDWPVPTSANLTRYRLIVTGLELILREPDRREKALVFLEKAAACLAEPGGGNALAGIVVIAERSPFERILDAFESCDRKDAPSVTSREELRWARLFQDFTTFSFGPIDKLDQVMLEAQLPDPRAPVRVLAEEFRWLPGNIIDGVIADTTSRNLLQDSDVVFPIDHDRYRTHYTPKILNWSKKVAPTSAQAAIDYLRANLIEHYEQCWEASSFAERVILDTIACGGFVNMRKAVALQSLVRRGLVLLDPAPRLMNRSFALFLRQVERPATLTAWRDKQAPSPWAFIQRPVRIAVPLLVLALAFAAAESGQELTALFSLLAAGMPALIGTALRSARSITA